MQEKYGRLLEEFESTIIKTPKDDHVASDGPEGLAMQNDRLKEALRRLQALTAAEAERQEARLREALAEAARAALKNQTEANEKHQAELSVLQAALGKASDEIAELSQVGCDVELYCFIFDV